MSCIAIYKFPYFREGCFSFHRQIAKTMLITFNDGDSCHLPATEIIISPGMALWRNPKWHFPWKYSSKRIFGQKVYFPEKIMVMNLFRLFKSGLAIGDVEWANDHQRWLQPSQSANRHSKPCFIYDRAYSCRVLTVTASRIWHSKLSSGYIG